MVRMAKDGMEIAVKRKRLRAANVRRRLLGASASEDGSSAYAAGSVAELIKKRGREKEVTGEIQPAADVLQLPFGRGIGEVMGRGRVGSGLLLPGAEDGSHDDHADETVAGVDGEDAQAARLEGILGRPGGEDNAEPGGDGDGDSALGGLGPGAWMIHERKMARMSVVAIAEP